MEILEKNEDVKLLDEALKRLKAIGVEQIRYDTKLDCSKIEDILQKRFENLDYVRARGFIDILQKQYHIDLSQWLEEYKQYHLAQRKTTPPPPLAKPVQKQKLKYVIYGVCGFLLLVCIYLLIWFFYSSENVAVPKPLKTQNQELSVPQEKIDQDLQGVQKEQEQEKEIAKPIQEAPQPEAKEVKVEKPEIKHTKKLSEYGKNVFENFVADEADLLYWQSPKPLWVGVISLETQKKASKTRRKSEIPLNEDILIVSSRGDMIVSWKNEEKEFDPRFPVYLIYTKEGGLKQLSKEEFLELNGGEEW